jgi:TolB protein
MVLSLLVSSCARNKPASLEPTITPSETASVVQTQSPQPTSSPTLLPTSAPVNSDQTVGIIVFSMRGGDYQHLFVYQPNYLPITQLTSGNWDDADPSISPDGNSLAFTSNRTGQWDIYLWNLVDGQISQLTNSPEVEANIDWSPDNQWITYQVNAYGWNNIIIRSTSDTSIAPIQLTNGLVNNIDPAWSPLGRQVAFSSNRNGHYEIWIAQLDDAENRFSIVSEDDGFDHVSPAWSPDGLTLAWETQNEVSTVESRLISDSENSVVKLGTGKLPFWTPDGTSILARWDTPNQYFLTGFNSQSGNLTYPLISMPARTSRLQWANGKSFQNILNILSSQEIASRSPYCQPVQTVSSSSTGRFSLVELTSVDTANPFLSDMADECFNELRQSANQILGWDFLGILKSAALPITTSPDPKISQNWLYTGRGISLNLAPLDAGWMVVSREDFDGQTYWRIWVKCLQQDGSCGELLSGSVWDFPARASGNLKAFEDGGKTVPSPTGYWIDFTDLALQYGWQRIPSQENWRTYYPGILFNTIVYSQGKSWHQVMIELYPEDITDLLEPGR